MTDLSRENENLRRILEVARYMAVTNDLDVLLGTIVEATCEVLDCERATIFLYDAGRDQLYSRVAKGVDAIRFPADKGIAGVAARDRVCVNVPDAYSDERFNAEVDRRTGYRTRNLLTFPLENLDGNLIGVLQALNKRRAAFDAEDEALARVLSAQAGVALDRGRLLEEYAEKQRMQHDLEIARTIQQALFPKANPTLPGYEVAGWNRSADETGGDCYDFLPLADGRLAVFLADATGHGIGAALVMAQCRSLLRAMFSVTTDLQTIASGINRLLSEDLSDERFVTAFVGILDSRANRIDYVSCGQAPLLLVSLDSVDSRAATSLPLAVLPDATVDRLETFEFQPHSTLVLLTDGFFETADAGGELFGEARVASIVQTHTGSPLTELIEELYNRIRAFSNDAKQADDLTAVLIRRQGAPA